MVKRRKAAISKLLNRQFLIWFKKYEKIIEEYREKNYVIEALLKSEIGIETRNQTLVKEIIDKEL